MIIAMSEEGKRNIQISRKYSNYVTSTQYYCEHTVFSSFQICIGLELLLYVYFIIFNKTKKKKK
jgi:hypothetical protein